RHPAEHDIVWRDVVRSPLADVHTDARGLELLPRRDVVAPKIFLRGRVSVLRLRRTVGVDRVRVLARAKKSRAGPDDEVTVRPRPHADLAEGDPVARGDLDRQLSRSRRKC